MNKKRLFTKLFWVRAFSAASFIVFVLSVSSVLFQNCAPVRFGAADNSSTGATSIPIACNVSTYGTQPYSTLVGTGTCSCVEGVESCVINQCLDSHATLVHGVCVGASSLSVLINGSHAVSLVPTTSAQTLSITASGPIAGLKPGQSSINAVAGSCSKTSLSPSDLQIAGGALSLGNQSFYYGSGVAAQVAGCTFQVTAVADNGQSGSAQFTALLCQAGEPKASPNSCTTPDGQPGQLKCAQNGLSYQCVPIGPTPPSSCLFNGQTIANGASVQAFPQMTVPYGQTCLPQLRTCTNGTLSGSATYSACSPTPGLACSFNGQSVADGAQVMGYLASTVAYNQTCQSGSDVCHNGQLIGSYTYPSCSVAGNPDCSINGTIVPNGQMITVYQAPSVAYGQSCQSETLVCNNGTVKGTSADGTFYAYNSCAVLPPKDCNFNGTTVANGTSVTAYPSSVVPYGAQCVSEQRVCTNGSLSGTATNSGCTQGPGANCSYNGQSLVSGTSVTGFASASVAYGQSCHNMSSTCSNGSMAPPIYPACSVQPGAACSYNGQTVLDGASVNGYAVSSVAFGSSCQGASATCHNGTLSSQIVPSCTVQADPKCYAGGLTIANGASQTFYLSTQVPYGQSCQAETRSCANGVLSGSDTATSCSVAPAASCTFNGQTIANGQSVTAYGSAQVPYGQSCQSAQATCHNGTLALPSGYSYGSCAVAPPASCSFHGQTIADSQSVVAYLQPNVSYGLSCANVSETRVCANGTLSGSATNVSCAVNPPASCTFAGQTIADGISVTGYNTQSVPYGQTCQGAPATCSNGSLPLPPGYIYSSCAAASGPVYYTGEASCSHIGEPCNAADPVWSTTTVDDCGCDYLPRSTHFSSVVDPNNYFTDYGHDFNTGPHPGGDMDYHTTCTGGTIHAVEMQCFLQGEYICVCR